jgi:hypothetical protein
METSETERIIMTSILPGLIILGVLVVGIVRGFIEDDKSNFVEEDIL